MPVDTVALADQLIANYASSVSVLPEILSNLHIQEKSASIGALDMEAIQKSSPNAAEFTSSLDRKVVGLPQPIPIGTIPSLEEESSMDIQIAPAVEPKELPNANNRQDDDQTLSVGSQTPRNSDSEDEDGMETDGSDADWLSPNMLERPKLTLSFFGKIWTFLDRMITPQTKVWVQSPARHNDLPLSLDSQDIARLELFSKRILTTYNSMRRKYGLKLVLTNDLLGLLKTIRLLDSAVVLSSDEDWALCTVFLNVLSQTSEPIANEFESKWSDILAQVNLSTAELAVFTKAFL